MTTTDLVERVALDCRIATEATDVAAKLLRRLQAVRGRLDKRGVLSREERPARWIP